MAIEAEWIGGNGLYRRYFGILCIEDIMHENLKTVGDQRSDSLRYVIADFIDLEYTSIDVDDISKLSLFDAPTAKCIQNLKVAIVLPESSETLEALVKLYEFESKDRDFNSWDCELFSSVEDARQWVIPANTELKPLLSVQSC